VSQVVRGYLWKDTTPKDYYSRLVTQAPITHHTLRRPEDFFDNERRMKILAAPELYVPNETHSPVPSVFGRFHNSISPLISLVKWSPNQPDAIQLLLRTMSIILLQHWMIRKGRCFVADPHSHLYSHALPKELFLYFPHSDTFLRNAPSGRSAMESTDSQIARQSEMKKRKKTRKKAEKHSLGKHQEEDEEDMKVDDSERGDKRKMKTRDHTGVMMNDFESYWVDQAPSQDGEYNPTDLAVLAPFRVYLHKMLVFSVENMDLPDDTKKTILTQVERFVLHKIIRNWRQWLATTRFQEHNLHDNYDSDISEAHLACGRGANPTLTSLARVFIVGSEYFTKFRELWK